MKKISINLEKKLEFLIFRTIEICKAKNYDYSFTNQVRRKFFISLLLSIILTRSVVFSEIATELNDEVEFASNIRRIQRFMKDYQLSYEQIALMIAFFLPKGKWEVSIDRTNWQLGKKDFNILSVTVYVKGIGVPVWFEMLDNSGGNSNEGQRIDVFDKLKGLFGSGQISCVYGDREFIGQRWVGYLVKQEIDFYIRVKCNTRVFLSSTQTRGCYAEKLMHKRTRYLENIIVFGQRVNMVLKPLKTLKPNGKPDELLIITTLNAKSCLRAYKKRWSIEVFFQSIKKRGFNLEDTHLKEDQRLRKLLAAVCLAFVGCFAIGLFKHKKVKKIKTAKHGYKVKSFFRYGLDELRKALKRASRGKMDLLMDYFDKILTGELMLT